MATLHFRRIERRRTARVALCVDMIVRGETQNNLSRSEWVPIPAPRLGRATWVHEVRALCKKSNCSSRLWTNILLGRRRLIDLSARELAGVGLADFFNVGKITQPAGNEFRGNEVILGNEKGREAAVRVDHPFDTPRPCLIKIYAIDARENIHCDRFPSKADEFPRIRQVVNRDVAKRGPKIGK